MRLVFRTYPHLGDVLTLSGAMHNLKLLHPDWEIGYDGRYGDVFLHTENAKKVDRADKHITVAYRMYQRWGEDKVRLNDEHRASAGIFVDGFTRSMSQAIMEDIPAVTHKPHIKVTEEEMLNMLPYAGCWVLNSNCQMTSMTKGYPWWQQVVDLCHDKTFVLIGSRDDDRDVRQKVQGKNVIDLRGKTATRDLFALVSLADGVVSPASSVCHIAGALDIPCVQVSGAREPAQLLAYPHSTILTSHCYFDGKHYNGDYGCMRRTTPIGDCGVDALHNGRGYARCMTAISPQEVADAIHAK